jgi:hypothetical protein
MLQIRSASTARTRLRSAAPTYGVVGSVPSSQSLYDRFLLIVGKERHDRELFDIKCESTGSLSTMSRILLAMIDSAFVDFPGVSGRTKSYTKALAR